MVRIRIPSVADIFGFNERWLNEHLSLLENAKESLRHGVEHYLQPSATTSDFKQAVVNIHLGFELALKEALRRKHPAFIFERFDVDTLQALIDGQSLLEEERLGDTTRTISFEETRSRARKLLGLKQQPANFLVALNRLRRTAVHYTFTLDQEVLDGLLGAQLKPAVDMVFGELLGERDVLSTLAVEALERIQTRVHDPIALNLYRRIADAKAAWLTLSEDDRRSKVTNSLRLRQTDTKFETCPACGQVSFEPNTQRRIIDHDPEGYPIDIPETTRARCACCPLEIEGDEAIYYCDWRELRE